MDSLDLVVVGSDTPAGAVLIELLEDGRLPGARVRAVETLAGEESLERFDFAGARVAVFCAGEAIAARHAPRATAAGCRVIDTSPRFRGADGVPLAVPELDPQVPPRSAIVATPGAAATVLALALQPIEAAAGIEAADVVVLLPVSEGQPGAVEELGRQTADLLSFRPVEPRVLPRQIAFNVLAATGGGDADSADEVRIAQETRALLRRGSLDLAVTAVQVPVFYGLCMAVHLRMREPLDAASAHAALAQAPWIDLEEPDPSPVTHASGHDEVFVGRLRQGAGERCLKLWITADNLRRGVALTALGMAKKAAGDYL